MSLTLPSPLSDPATVTKLHSPTLTQINATINKTLILPESTMTAPVPPSRPTPSSGLPPIPKIKLHRNPDAGWALAPNKDIPTVTPNVPVSVAPLSWVP